MRTTERAGATYALGVLFAINAMNFFDRQIIGAVGEPIRREWGLSDTQLGVLATVFTLLYAVVGLPLGRLSDRAPRKSILAGGVFVWSLMTAFSGIARNFGQLVVARLGVGVGEATCSPAATSLLGDLYPTTRRARAMSVFMLGLPIGLGLSSGIGAWVAQTYGWRTAFYVAGIPGLLCAVAALAIREPARGMLEDHAVGARRRPGSPYLLVLSIPTMWWVIASGAFHNFNMYAFGQFMVPFLIRYHGVTLRNAGYITMVVYGLSGIVGLVGGGVLADRLYQKRVDGRLLVATGSIVLCLPFMFLALLMPGGSVVAFSLLMGFGCGVMYAYYSTVYATIQDVVEPALRGTGMALYFFAMYVCGASLGPLGTGLASDYFTFRAAAATGAVSPLPLGDLIAGQLRALLGGPRMALPSALEPFRGAGLHAAMFIVPAIGVLLAVVLWAASRTVTRDVARLQAWMREEDKLSVRS
jgi:predicted MFS family arabinose efflux permease